MLAKPRSRRRLYWLICGLAVAAFAVVAAVALYKPPLTEQEKTLLGKWKVTPKNPEVGWQEYWEFRPDRTIVYTLVSLQTQKAELTYTMTRWQWDGKVLQLKTWPQDSRWSSPAAYSFVARSPTEIDAFQYENGKVGAIMPYTTSAKFTREP